ncbi:type IV secretory pathway VirB6 component [endosymbiont of Acanthamoeba sp. UWC8]|uniref:type IV secretion system protein n=1 Tax=endosymbiont of Acanthamoeba sp. UWC8 TaxID=86106 RepID=UPI0004D122E5|nr:type IV secretion system protein [endosymbiont of Acanthamoeba sp. UWC8]AIF81462.1 type IV secretory pathway VirB6 component [endosymbiont of Acanthamoeba sp. UWC8]
MTQIKYGAKLLLVFFFLLIIADEALAFNSLEEFESYQDNGTFACLRLNKISGHDETQVLYDSFQKSKKEREEYHTRVHTPLNASMFSYVTNFARQAIGAVDSLVGAIPMMHRFTLGDICTNAYIVRPHEYINRMNGWIDSKVQPGGGYRNQHSLALTATDIPFYYSCDPEWDPLHNSKIYRSEAERHLRGKVWGYMGAASPFCAGIAKNYALKELVGQVRIEYADSYSPRNGNSSLSAREGKFLKAGESAELRSVIFHAYNYFNTALGKMQLCVATPETRIPIKVGCTSIAPPVERAVEPPFLEQIKSTRCYHLISGREDLQSLGRALSITDQHSRNGLAMKLFLESEFHVTSTVVGCVKDMILKVFLGANQSNKRGLLNILHENFRGLVFAVLVLYVSLVGIKIMSSTQVPNQGEFLMYIIKFTLVLVFTGSGTWYYYQQGEAKGLFPAITSATEELSLIFFKVQVDKDPVGLCNYWFEGKELLGQRDINVFSFAGKIEPTAGSHNVKLTFWDFVDCKLANYLNFGSCHYSMSGMISMWIGAAALFVSGDGFLLTIISVLYVFLLLLIIFRFTSVFIHSLFIVAILILISPIMLCFSLFNPTKNIFQSWFRMIIGYIIAPAVLFILLSFMLTVLDSIYFGELTTKSAEIKEHNIPITQACKDIDSIFCTTVGMVAKDPCSANIGVFAENYIEPVDLGALGEFKRLKPLAIKSYFHPALKLLLFVTIFYFFVGGAIKLIVVLTGVYGIADTSRGSINILSPVRSLVGMAAGNASHMLGMSVGKIVGGGDRDDNKVPRR